ncbi:MAG TPA: hypothetical protein IAA98_02455 [Candidatus Avipropionibacterium avicola]|uniref:Glutaredoxin domain-containing protein n=1 Tax=Candidatus Avipropionibacterium avicola TaxID=2840701 RepID=A0A9D1GW70_9ACTN|nr:hypothetical protein [Candidatus Avipropionibacterium avicola]
MKSVAGWLGITLVIALALGWVAWSVGDGAWAGYVIAAVAVLVSAWWRFPLRGSRSDHPGGRDADGDWATPVVIHWRPGCMYCSALRARLGRTGRRATWVNIWKDPVGRDYVRSVNDGNETVPTVVIDGTAHTNPPPELVRQRLEQLR